MFSALTRVFILNKENTFEIIANARFLALKPVSSLFTNTTDLYTSTSPHLIDSTPYRHLIGCLLYLTTTRPDIFFTVQIPSQFIASPTKVHQASPWTRTFLPYNKQFEIDLFLLFRLGHLSNYKEIHYSLFYISGKQSGLLKIKETKYYQLILLKSRVSLPCIFDLWSPVEPLLTARSSFSQFITSPYLLRQLKCHLYDWEFSFSWKNQRHWKRLSCRFAKITRWIYVRCLYHILINLLIYLRRPYLHQGSHLSYLCWTSQIFMVRLTGAYKKTPPNKLKLPQPHSSVSNPQNLGFTRVCFSSSSFMEDSVFLYSCLILSISYHWLSVNCFSCFFTLWVVGLKLFCIFSSVVMFFFNF